MAATERRIARARLQSDSTTTVPIRIATTVLILIAGYETPCLKRPWSSRTAGHPVRNGTGLNSRAQERG